MQKRFPGFLLAVSAAFIVSLVPAQAFSQTNWSQAATWGGRIPQAGDHVVIPKGKTVILDIPTPTLKGLKIEGALVAAPKDLSITSDYVVVAGGKLQIGTAVAPFRNRMTITLTGNTAVQNPKVPGLGNKVLGLMGGCLDIHGDSAPKSWTQLAADVSPGAKTIQLAEEPKWKAGDVIVIATSTRDMKQYDQVTVQSVSGRVVNLVQSLKFKHLGTHRTFGATTVDVRAEVGLLSRNIVIQGDAQSEALKVGGHAMFMNGMCPGTGTGGCQCGVPSRGAEVRISNAEFRRMGQHNQLGRYPIHFHLMGETQNNWVKNCSVHSSIQRGIVLHDVSGVTVSGNVVFNTVGHNLVVETEVTKGNFIEGNLCLVNRQPSPLFTEPTLVTQNDRQPANYWMRSGQNLVQLNRAAGSFNSGFIYDGIDGAAINFRRNTVHAAMGLEGNGAGDFDLSAGVLIITGYDRPITDVVQDTLAYHNTIGMWPEESGLFVIDRLVAVDNDLHTENRGVGNRVLYKNPTFIGRLSEPREFPGSPVHIQYGSDVQLVNPHFVNHGGVGIASMTDIAEPYQANLWVSGATYFGERPYASVGDDQVTTYLDDSLAPKGTYVWQRWLALPDAKQVSIGAGDEGFTMWQNSRRVGYTELDVRGLGAPTVGWLTKSPITRGDGLRFQAGMFGYTVITNSAVRYDIEGASARGFGVRLFDGVKFEPAVQSGAATVLTTAPLNAAPSAVHRSSLESENPAGATAANRLRAAASLADFQANPLSTYWYVPSTKRVWFFADKRWVLILP